ncbi:hypothetical protein AAP_00259 [Ascosphaera apis ARSEF 7405]|uniref:Uncharacterized protein n=1 Tax=Ascosphaera apis ARSEF 7405 TaxID=392613 RepID=A0A168DQE9_9EURO|nr:hypothetical protein AAP_00259 [Ascosphaera apis ARSEF 7405]
MASAGYPFPEAEWIPPTASKDEAQRFVQNYLSWTLQRAFDDPKVEKFAKRFDHSALFLYNASEKEFQEIFGEELGSKFHYHMNYRSPYGYSANMRKHLVSYTSNASGYFSGLANLLEETSRPRVAKKRGSTSSASSVKSAGSVEMDIPSMPSAPARVYRRGRTRRVTADYVLDHLDSI